MIIFSNTSWDMFIVGVFKGDIEGHLLLRPRAIKLAKFIHFDNGKRYEI